jgi:hypothetical protein
MERRRKISLKELENIIKNIPREKIEEECHAWGCVDIHYKELIYPEAVTRAVAEYLKNKI